MAEKQCNLVKNGGGMKEQEISDFLTDTTANITYSANISANSVVAVKNGNALSIRVFDGVPTQTLGTSATYAIIGELPVNMRPSTDLLKLILIGSIYTQLRIDTNGGVKVGYAYNLITQSSYDLTTSDHLFINETFVL